MKRFLMPLLLALVLVTGVHAQKVNTDSDNVKSMFISALGEADTARAVAHSVCSFKDTVLSSTDIDALNATPVSLVPAPGTGKTLILCNVVTWLNYGGTAWAGSSETIPIKWGTAGATATTITEAYMERTADTVGVWGPVSGAFPVENAALYATANADFTTGNSPLSVRVYYQTIGASVILSN